DLEDGSARTVGEPETLFNLQWGRSSIGTTPVVSLCEIDGVHPERRFGSSAYELLDTFDARTGTHMSGETWKSVNRDAGSLENLLERSRAAMWLPDGSRCWMTARELHCEERSGATSSHVLRDASPTMWDEWLPLGGGFALVRNRWYFSGFVDPREARFISRDVVNKIPSLSIEGFESSPSGGVVSIRADGWLLWVAKAPRGSRRHRQKANS